MQTFIDTVTNKVWQFEDDVIVTDTNGVYSFKTATGMPLSNTPTTLQPYTIPAPSYLVFPLLQLLSLDLANLNMSYSVLHCLHQTKYLLPMLLTLLQ